MRSSVDILNFDICGQALIIIVLFSSARILDGFTNPEDVMALNLLFVSLGSPRSLLTHWIPNGGDPCTENWTGVTCNGSAVYSIIVNGANFGGVLGNNLGLFLSIERIDLSSNQIGGNIPPTLPATLQHLSLNNNLLTGEIPDSFESLSGIINIDLSSNNLSGHLPPSMSSLLSLTTLHLQNNQLFGDIDILQDLPLQDLNIENNMFSGAIPVKLLSIPNFKEGGNLFNSSFAPVSSPTPPSTQSPPQPIPKTPPLQPSSRTPPVQTPPGNQADQPSASQESNPGKRSKHFSTKKVVWLAISSILMFVILALGVVFLLTWCSTRRREAEVIPKRRGTTIYDGTKGNLVGKDPLVRPSNEVSKVPNEVFLRTKEENQKETGKIGLITKPLNAQETNVPRTSLLPRERDHEIDINSFEMMCLPPPLPPLSPPPPLPEPSRPPPSPVEMVVVHPNIPTQIIKTGPSTKTQNVGISVKLYTIAALQQYTNSFAQENFVGAGMLGSVYRAQLPDRKLLVVKKLDKLVSDQQKDDEFLDMVNNIDRIRHANVVQLMGYCAEHGQRLLIYECCNNGTLQDALHSDNEEKLVWNTRIRIALGAARALQYLHEDCDPPIVHRNVKSANILLDDEFLPHLSDCGLAPLLSYKSANQLSGHLQSAYGYGAPEFESGTYTDKSDVYSFGVVMLEILTGRKSYDGTRARGEQSLVRWAIPQLHDIDSLSRMVDPSLAGEYQAKALSNFADIISRCVQTEPEFRPTMSVVMQDLMDMLRKEHVSLF